VVTLPDQVAVYFAPGRTPRPSLRARPVVFDAYGWPRDLTDEQILEKLVVLNAERAEEEKNGLIR
jgi:hypothetical protein